jgi:hypothetical protein
MTPAEPESIAEIIGGWIRQTTVSLRQARIDLAP